MLKNMLGELDKAKVETGESFKNMNVKLNVV